MRPRSVVGIRAKRPTLPATGSARSQDRRSPYNCRGKEALAEAGDRFRPRKRVALLGLESRSRKTPIGSRCFVLAAWRCYLSRALRPQRSSAARACPALCSRCTARRSSRLWTSPTMPQARSHRAKPASCGATHRVVLGWSSARGRGATARARTCARWSVRPSSRPPTSSTRSSSTTRARTCLSR